MSKTGSVSIILVLGIVAIALFHLDKRNNERNDIDELESSLIEVLSFVPNGSSLYFYSNYGASFLNKIYKPTQFVLAPRILLISRFDEIPSGGLILLIQSDTYDYNVFLQQNHANELELLMETNKTLNIKLYKKKQQ